MVYSKLSKSIYPCLVSPILISLASIISLFFSRTEIVRYYNIIKAQSTNGAPLSEKDFQMVLYFAVPVGMYLVYFLSFFVISLILNRINKWNTVATVILIMLSLLLGFSMTIPMNKVVLVILSFLTSSVYYWLYMRARTKVD